MARRRRRRHGTRRRGESFRQLPAERLEHDGLRVEMARHDKRESALPGGQQLVMLGLPGNERLHTGLSRRRRTESAGARCKGQPCGSHRRRGVNSTASQRALFSHGGQTLPKRGARQLAAERFRQAEGPSSESGRTRERPRRSARQVFTPPGARSRFVWRGRWRRSRLRRADTGRNREPDGAADQKSRGDGSQ